MSAPQRTVLELREIHRLGRDSGARGNDLTEREQRLRNGISRTQIKHYEKWFYFPCAFILLGYLGTFTLSRILKNPGLQSAFDHWVSWISGSSNNLLSLCVTGWALVKKRSPTWNQCKWYSNNYLWFAIATICTIAFIVVIAVFTTDTESSADNVSLLAVFSFLVDFVSTILAIKLSTDTDSTRIDQELQSQPESTSEPPRSASTPTVNSLETSSPPATFGVSTRTASHPSSDAPAPTPIVPLATETTDIPPHITVAQASTPIGVKRSDRSSVSDPMPIATKSSHGSSDIPTSAPALTPMATSTAAGDDGIRPTSSLAIKHSSPTTTSTNPPQTPPPIAAPNSTDPNILEMSCPESETSR